MRFNTCFWNLNKNLTSKIEADSTTGVYLKKEAKILSTGSICGSFTLVGRVIWNTPNIQVTKTSWHEAWYQESSDLFGHGKRASWAITSFVCIAPLGEPPAGQGGDHQHGAGNGPGWGAASSATRRAGEEEQRQQCPVRQQGTFTVTGSPYRRHPAVPLLGLHFPNSVKIRNV